ncbi:MetQ/NlpA family ABC transporter substrate-binding protein [Crassaminicella profunda]|uniref:MetQ/NlpA family ABC transporter substrate-binding protein n=1 Tax=Crassaminicella profunda TaxID=1286698 RepID=UPI001CA6EAFC|nr:MetQ/NlpA family ABC transporter substrate-binding protein [Crassaminicella profunda]QZY54766.1 MetQ/NlpA family ABC transporter substrate-binding protein [Crassaminicella profunda]
MKKILFTLLSMILIFSLLTGCSSKENTASSPLRVGATAGPHEQIVEKVKEIAKTKGLEVEIVSFNDYIQPNVQLYEKQLDLNSYQHTPYLDKFNKDHHMDLVKLASTVNFPMGIYSNQLKSLDELKEGDKISLPNDPTNEARALLLLQSANVIKLKDTKDLNLTIKDIAENPKNIEFIELDAPMVAHSLEDVAVAAINTNYAMQAGFSPADDSIFIEPKDSPWVNIIAARPDNKDDKRIKQFIEIYQSEEMKQFIEDIFGGSVVPGF